MVELKNSFINCKMGRHILCELLPDKLFDAVDTSLFGMSITYTHPEMVASVIKWLGNKPKCRKVNIGKLYRKHSDHVFKEHEGYIPVEVQKSFIQGNRAKEVLVRKLLRQRQMAMKGGFDFPTTKFAREVGVDQKTIHRWRKELIDLGFIKCIDATYKINKKAMTFKAIGVFKFMVKKIFTTKQPPNNHKITIKLPDSIPSGEWQNVIWEYSKYYMHDPDKFINWVTHLPYSQTKRRLRKAYSALISRLKYAGLPHNHLVF
jgi:DNA-binding Lrp family transcriptional regulator